MDHLPYPGNPPWPLIDIPYLCGDLDEYDGAGFIDYPVRRGWARTIQSSQWIDCPWEVAAKRAQNWLYFGLLREMLGSNYDQKMFLRPSLVPGENHYFINTQKLPILLHEWSRSVRQLRSAFFGPKSSSAVDFFNRSREVLWEVNIQSDRLDREAEYCRIITLGIKILHDSLQRAILNVDIKYSKDTLHSERAAPSRLLNHLMLHKGWCPRQVVNILPEFSVTTVNYIAALPRSLASLGHRNCNADACIANNVDEDQYNLVHTEEQCECQFRGPDVFEVIRLITEGNTPLISITISHNRNPRLEVLKAEPHVQYTAISHVWSGGLGNFQSNTLPTCQLLRLCRLLTDLRGSTPNLERPCFGYLKHQLSPLWKRVWSSVFTILARAAPQSRRGYLPLNLDLPETQERKSVVFWMDTLCIPVGEENSHLRAKAINSMALVFAGAQDVLVLDPELQKIHRAGLTQEQLNTHVLCSPWMSRCWTLQEGRLSMKWYAQFADGLFDPECAEKLCAYQLKEADRKLSWDDMEFLRQETISWYSTMRPTRKLSMFEQTFISVDRFSDEWDHLTKRSTTKKEDVHCIMANMLDLSASEILSLPYIDRMKAILRSEDVLPFSLLFSPGPKIQDVYNRWIPYYPGGDTVELSYGRMRLATDGLIFDQSTAGYDGFLVASSVPRLNHFRIGKSAGSEPFWASIKHDGTDPAFESPTSIATCYIIGKVSDPQYVRPSSFQIAKNSTRSGARFGVQRQEGCVLHLLYEYPLRFYYGRPEIFDPKSGRYIEDQSDFPLIDADLLDPEQTYQVDCG